MSAPPCQISLSLADIRRAGWKVSGFFVRNVPRWLESLSHIQYNLLHVGGGIRCRPNPAATELVVIVGSVFSCGNG